MENPMQKMFSGHKYSKDDIESNFINIDADISLEELEEFYKKVRDTQIHGLHELALKHHRESTKNIAEVLRILNESDNKEVVDAVNKILSSFKKELIESLNVNNNMQNYKFVETDSIAGESKLNEETKRMEFLPDEDSIAELAIALFYTSKD